jgi:hypothetical protein
MRLSQRKKVVAASKILGEEDFRTKKNHFFQKNRTTIGKNTYLCSTMNFCYNQIVGTFSYSLHFAK